MQGSAKNPAHARKDEMLALNIPTSLEIGEAAKELYVNSSSERREGRGTAERSLRLNDDVSDDEGPPEAERER